MAPLRVGRVSGLSFKYSIEANCAPRLPNAADLVGQQQRFHRHHIHHDDILRRAVAHQCLGKAKNVREENIFVASVRTARVHGLSRSELSGLR